MVDVMTRSPASRTTRPSPTLQLVILAALVALVYFPTHAFDFIALDDPRAVYQNADVVQGLTPRAVWSALTTVQAPYWHPVTTLSHMLDVELFGLDAGGHHIINVLWHLANTLLVFVLLRHATQATGRSLFVAALFAVHPIHVESVAWVAERKDVLSTFFLLITIWRYAQYVQRRTWGNYAVMVLPFVLGLLAKPMLVTLPFALLLLDVWPLERAEFPRRMAGLWTTWRPLLREKIVLFVLAGASSVGTLLVETNLGAVSGLDRLPVVHRLSNAILSYVKYIGAMFWPTQLSVFYPYPVTLPPWPAIAGAFVCLILVSVLVVRSSRRWTYLAVGWGWYLGTLVPVIGLVQAGSQAMADRFAYVPLLGLYVIVAWGAWDWLGRSESRRRSLVVAGAAVVVTCAWLAHRQVLTWSDTVSVWSHAIRVDDGNHRAHMNLGYAFEQQGRLAEAVAHYRRGVDLLPIEPTYRNILGYALIRTGNAHDAIEHLTAALAIDPEYAAAHTNLGLALTHAGHLDRARYHYTEALRVVPTQPEAHNNLAAILVSQGDLSQAKVHFKAALDLEPTSAKRHNNLGAALLIDERYDEAIVLFEKALELDPTNVDARINLEHALKGLERPRPPRPHYDPR